VPALLMVATAVLAQTAGAFTGPSIVPVTGPSTAPSLPEPAKVNVIPAPVRAQAGKVAGPREGAAVGAPAATAPQLAARSTKVVHTPGAKATVKRAAAPSRVTRTAARPPATKHVATVKRRAPTRQPIASKPVPVANRQPSGKASPAPQPVLPRV
jgi:hypothetical protein